MLALSMLYSLSLIVLGLCADARWRIGGAVAVMMVAGLVASAGLVLHAWPGHEGLVVLEQQVLKADSLSVSLYLNHDKVLVAWSLLGWLPLFGRSVSPGEVPLCWSPPCWRVPEVTQGGLSAFHPDGAGWKGVRGGSSLSPRRDESCA